MSRVPPFSQGSARRPSVQDNGVLKSTATKPLQINRTRPGTPSSSSVVSTSSSAQYPSAPSPTRPQRSGLRSRRISEYSISDGMSVDLRTSGDRQDASDEFSPQTRINPSVPTRNGSRPVRSPTSPSSEQELTPTSLAVLSVFQNAVARRRAGTYDEEYERAREKELEVQKARQKKIRDKAPDRKATKPRAGDIDAVLDEIKDEWALVVDPDFNPVDLALQLLDDSSSGKDMDSFVRTKEMLSKALKGSVDRHYQAFAAALPHHASLLSHLSVAQTQITDARTALQEAKDSLSNKRSDLVQLWTRNQTVEEMIRILDQIEQLRTVPDALETLISEKRLLQAAALLVRSLKLINKQDMMEIGALSDLRSYLNAQESALREILIDELHSHLYLKSFWCESRWSVYTPSQRTFPIVEFESESLSNDISGVASSPISPTARSTHLTRFLNDLMLRPNDPPYDANESASGTGLSTSTSIGLSTAPSLSSFSSGFPPTTSPRNPEADSFVYIETLLESLAVLGKLGNGLDIVTQRLPGEVFSMVDATLEEVADRAEYGRRGSVLGSMGAGSSAGKQNDILILSPVNPSTLGMNTGTIGVVYTPTMIGSATSNGTARLSSVNLRLAALESSHKQIDQDILRDFFWTLYSKLDAVAQGLRVVYEVANRIGSRRDFRDSSGTKPGSLFPLAEVWMPIQAEIRALLSDYITDEEQGAVTGRNPISSINEVLREGKFSRDKTKPIFRFADTDIKLSTKTLKHHEDELTRVLKDTVPGLVQGSSEGAVQATLSAVGTDDRLMGTGNHHRLLVHPDAFHVSVLFQPTMAFMDRITDILPSGLEAAQSSNEVLDEFVLKVYLPQLEDKVSLLFHQTITSPDAFQPDPASTMLSREPLVKASVQVMALINSLCAMLRVTPFHRESYSRLILTVIGQFYQRCSDRFYDLVSAHAVSNTELKSDITLAAHWAQRPELISCLTELFSLVRQNHATAKTHQLIRQETHLEHNILGNKQIDKVKLVSSTRNLSALASLYQSVTWFAAELSTLTSSSEGTLSPTTATVATPYTPYQPALIPPKFDEPLHLPLSSAMALRFQALHKTYDQLAELILYSLRIDIRCRAIHHLTLALREGHYYLDGEAAEPDPHIIDFNMELSNCDDFASTTLPEAERRFLFEGLGHLIEHLLISNARYIHLANVFGIRKMLRNILALQQNIRTISAATHITEFERVKRYYDLFFMSSTDMLESIRHKQEFNFDEYKTMLDLQCGVDPSGGEAAGAQATDRNHGMYVIDLHGLELENTADEDND